MADKAFFDRANAHINLANEQMKAGDNLDPGEISASFMWAEARFNAWLASTGSKTGEEMAGKKEKMVEYFVEEYRKMLNANLDDYIKNFDKYYGNNQ